MEAFTVHTGLVAPLDRVNVDTDQILPKQYMKGITRDGLGKVLFAYWRCGADGQPLPEFVLNQAQFAGATVLVAGKNFGSGSSREHAVWALMDYGFRTVIAPTFADIFYNNCFKNGILPVALPEPAVQQLLNRAEHGDGYRVTVDLEACQVRDTEGFQVEFKVDPYRRDCLLKGLDEIGLTLQHDAEIAAYEAMRPAYRNFMIK